MSEMLKLANETKMTLEKTQNELLYTKNIVSILRFKTVRYYKKTGKIIKKKIYLF